MLRAVGPRPPCWRPRLFPAVLMLRCHDQREGEACRSSILNLQTHIGNITENALADADIKSPKLSSEASLPSGRERHNAVYLLPSSNTYTGSFHLIPLDDRRQSWLTTDHEPVAVRQNISINVDSENHLPDKQGNTPRLLAYGPL